MAAHGARRLGRMTKNLSVILGIEAMCAAQGIEQRAPLTTSARLQAVMQSLRAVVPSLKQDRYLAPDIQRAATCVTEDMFAHAAGLEVSL